MEMLVKEQKIAALPSREIFTGDPLHYLTFIRTFEHCTEDRKTTFMTYWRIPEDRAKEVKKKILT